MSNVDAFFNQLDEKTTQNKEQKVQRDAECQEQRELARRILKDEIAPLLRKYTAGLESRGWAVGLEITDAAFTLELFYSDGCGNRLAFVDNGRTCLLSKRFSNDDHGSYSSYVNRSGLQTLFNPFDKKWTLEWFETQALQQFINDHRFYADRHKGIKKA